MLLHRKPQVILQNEKNSEPFYGFFLLLIQSEKIHEFLFIESAQRYLPKESGYEPSQAVLTNYGGLAITTTVSPKLSNRRANFEIFMIQKMVLERNLVPTLRPKPASTGIISGMHCMWTQVRTTLSKKPWQNQNIPCLVE